MSNGLGILAQRFQGRDPRKVKDIVRVSDVGNITESSLTRRDLRCSYEPGLKRLGYGKVISDWGLPEFSAPDSLDDNPAGREWLCLFARS